MMTRAEEQYYNNIGRIARALERITVALEFEAGMRTFKDSGADAESKLTAAGIGNRIKERLNELDMSRHDLAMACGVDEKKIRNYTIGYTVPKGPTCAKIAEALECSVEWLLGTGGKENERLVINDEFPQTEEEPIKLTLSIEPCDILAVTHADDGRALVSLAIGNNIEVQLTVEEKAEDFMDRLIDREGREDCSTCKYGNDTNGTRCRDCLEFDKWTGRKK